MFNLHNRKCKGMICLDNSFSIGLETKCHWCGASKNHSTDWRVTYNIVTTVSMYVFIDIYIYTHTYIIYNVTPCKHVNDFFCPGASKSHKLNVGNWRNLPLGMVSVVECEHLTQYVTGTAILQGLPSCVTIHFQSTWHFAAQRLVAQFSTCKHLIKHILKSNARLITAQLPYVFPR